MINTQGASLLMEKFILRQGLLQPMSLPTPLQVTILLFGSRKEEEEEHLRVPFCHFIASTSAAPITAIPSSGESPSPIRAGSSVTAAAMDGAARCPICEIGLLCVLRTPGDAGQTGGAASVTPTVSVQNATQGGSIGATTATGNIAVSGTSLSVQGTTLDGNTLPSHSHQPQAAQVCDSGTGRFCVDAGAEERIPYSWVTTAGNSQAHAHSIYDPGHSHGFSAAPHTHSFTGVAHTHTATVSAISTVPPYYKMAYCVKLPE